MTVSAAIGKFLLKQASGELLELIKTGKVGPLGSILRNRVTGQVVGYAQETKAMAALALAANPPTAVLGAGYYAVAMTHTVFDTNRTAHRIELSEQKLQVTADRIESKVDGLGDKLGRAQTSLDTLSDLGLANLAMSAAGIGISVAGFAVMSAKIDGVRHAIAGVASSIDAISAQVAEFGQDLIEADFVVLKTLAQQMDEGWLLTDSNRAERQWHDVARGAHQMQNRFASRASNLLGGPSPYLSADPMLDAYALASGLRVAAYAACNEIAAAREAGAEGARGLDQLTGNIGLADLVRKRLEVDAIAPGSNDWAVAQAQASEDLRPVVRKMREREAALVTRTAPLVAVEARGLRPHDWLRAAHEEQEFPVLLLLADDAGTG